MLGRAMAVTAAILMAGGAATAAQAATASRSLYGMGADAKRVELIRLANDRGMSVALSTRGGDIIELNVPDRTGKTTNVVVGNPDFAYREGHWKNAIIGRYANRITGGGFTLDGVFYPLAGANPTTRVASHGGPDPFHRRVWSAETFQRADAAGAILTLVSPDGDQGFPGEMTVKVTYTLTNQNVLRLDYQATTTKPTVLNLTNHAYFNLGGHENGPIYDEVLQVFASRYTPADERLVPTGEIAAVEGTPFDFRRPARLAERLYSTHPQILMGRGLDHNMVLDKPAGVAIPIAVRLTDPKSGRQLEVRTTEPGVQIYSSNGFNGTELGADGRTLRQSDAIAFETQHFPDSPNKPNFPSTVLRPGQTFRSTTEFAFSTDRTPLR